MASPFSPVVNLEALEQLLALGLSREDALDCLKVLSPFAPCFTFAQVSNNRWRITETLKVCGNDLSRAAEYYYNGDLQKVSLSLSPRV